MITRRHFCDMCILFINRIKRSLLQKEKKEGHKKDLSLKSVLSLSLSKHAAFALCALLCLSPSTVQAPSLRNGGSEMTKRKERKKERKERKKGRILNPK